MEFTALVQPDSVWHKLTVEECKEVTRIQLNSFLASAQFADDEETEKAVWRLALVFW